MKFNKTLIFILLFIIVGATILGFLSTVNYENRLIIRGKVFNIDVADSSYALIRGLSGRKSISKDEGMFFIFEKLDKHGFWMKDMYFPIDIIWIDQNFIVNHIEKSVDPKTYPKVFYPEETSMYVLEISAGQSDLLGIKLGDRVDFQYKNRI